MTFFQKRIGHLNGAFAGLRVRVVEDERRKRGAAEAAAIRRFADEHDIPAGRIRRCGGMDDAVVFDQPERDDVHEAIVAIPFVQVHVARNRRHADRIAVGRDAVDDALRDVPAMRLVQRTETQRIRERDYARTHAQHVAHDAADTGRRTFERHDL